MVAPQTNQGLRLLIVALALSAAVPRTAADAVTSLGSTTMAATLALSSVPVGSLQITKLAGGNSGTCGVTATVQPTDDVASIITAYPALSSPSDLTALNPALDVTKPLTAGMSLCVGDAGSETWCNTPLTGGICPTEAAGTPLVDWSTSSLSLTTPLNEALTLTPDLGIILQDPETKASMFYLAGVQSLVMKVPPTSAAAHAVADHPGHPHLGLWLASGSDKPMIIVVRPSWFSDGSSYYAYIPGSELDSLVAFPVSGGSTSWLSQLSSSVSSSLAQQAQSLLSAIGGKRKLLSATGSRKLLQSYDPPAGSVKGSGCGSWCYGR